MTTISFCTLCKASSITSRWAACGGSKRPIYTPKVRLRRTGGEGGAGSAAAAVLELDMDLIFRR
jgi:hypothetical protein